MTAQMPGTPIEMRSGRVTFTVPSGTDPVCLIVGADGRVVSAAGVVFYNQPSAPGMHLDGQSVTINPDALEAGTRIRCAASTDHGPITGCLYTIECDRQDISDALPELPDTGAVVCAEMVLQQGYWQIDPVAERYSGIAQLLVDHGVDVAGPEPGTSSASRATEHVAAQGAGSAALGDEFRAAMNRALAIFEDAARSAAGYVAAVQHAQSRLDAELSASLEDTATRTGEGAIRAREKAQHRADTLEAAAQQRFDADARQLMNELDSIDPHLPPAMATWQSTSWSSPGGHPASGIRIGELSAPDRSGLRIPFCVPTPLARGIWALPGPDAAAEPVLTSLAVRLIAASDRIEVDVVDAGAELAGLHRLLAPFLTRPAVVDALDIADRLIDLENALDLADMHAQSAYFGEVTTTPVPVRLVIVNGPAVGWDPSALAHLLRIVERAPSVGWSVLIAGDLDPADTDPLLMTLADHCMPLPLSDAGTAHDPWVGLRWSVRPETLDPDSEQAARLVSVLADRG